MKWKLFRIIPVIFCVLFFTQSLRSVDAEEICIICMEPLVTHEEYGEVVCLSCDQEHQHGHRFHRDCIERTLEANYHHTCPLCRAPNVTILPLPPTGFVGRFVQPIKNKIMGNISSVKEQFRDIKQRIFSNFYVSSLWQARNAFFAGAASALVGVPYVQGATASGIIGTFAPNTTLETAWHYPGAFTIGYVGALIYAATVKKYVCCWTSTSEDSPMATCIPFFPILGVAAFNLWRNS